MKSKFILLLIILHLIIHQAFNQENKIYIDSTGTKGKIFFYNSESPQNKGEDILIKNEKVLYRDIPLNGYFILYEPFKQYYSYDSTLNYFISKGELKEGNKHGYWEHMDSSKIIEKGYYQNNLKTGCWEEFRNYNSSLEFGDYFNGKKNGIWTSIDETQKYQLKSLIMFKMGKYNGAYYSYENDSLGYYLRFSSMYFDNKLNGNQIQYLNRTKFISRNYLNGKQEGLQIQYYYPSGNITSRTYFKNGLLNGISEKYYENGKLKSKTNWVNSMTHGELVYYYANGKIERKLFSQNGKTEGLYISYYGNGIIKFKGNFKNGEKNGICQWYWENGKLSETCNYKNDMRNGFLRTFNENGTKRFEGFVVDDEIQPGYKLYK